MRRRSTTLIRTISPGEWAQRQRRRINARRRRNSGNQPAPRLSNVADFLPGGQHYREQDND